jgi:hypothetical protein
VKAAIAIAAALAAVTVLGGCLHEPHKPVLDFDTRNNNITIDAPLTKKSKSEEWDGTHYEFIFQANIDGERHTTSVGVTKDIWSRYDKGDWVRLLCRPAEPCEERP